MPTPLPEELLSAYLDGELTAAEKAEVEARLAESPALREQLEDFAELSMAVKSLARPYAPAGFQAQVMQAIDKQFAPRPLRWLTRLRSSKTAVWSSAVSLVLLLGVSAWMASQPAPEQLAFTPADHAKLHGFGSQQTDALRDASSSSLVRESLASDPPVQIVGISKDEIRQKLLELHRMPIAGNGVVVSGRALSPDGDTPVVVELTVVDVMQAVNQMNVLLKRQNVRAVEGKPGQATRFHSRSGNSGGLGGSALTTVSLELEMEGRQMAEVLHSVPALDAVMYVEDDQSARPSETPLSTTSPTSDKANLALSADPDAGQPASQAASKATLGDEVRDESSERSQPVQFRFDRITAEYFLQNSSAPGNAPQEKNRSSEMPALQADAGAQSEAKSSPALAPKPALPAADGTPDTYGFVPATAQARTAGNNKADQPGSKDELERLSTAEKWEQAKKVRALILLKQQSKPVRTPMTE